MLCCICIVVLSSNSDLVSAVDLAHAGATFTVAIETVREIEVLDPIPLVCMYVCMYVHAYMWCVCCSTEVFRFTYVPVCRHCL